MRREREEERTIARLAPPGGPLPQLLVRLVAACLALIGVLAPAFAHAATLAVLPLERGAAGEDLEGLGTALAGMLVTDLADAEGLVLVERQRMDALLAEVELGKSGFVDPATAQRLGKGVGAELVLIGSFSVVEGTLAVDARLVEVESGRGLDGAKASGAVADFVTVEKTLAEDLIGELGATLDARGRRDFYSRVPTESWAAFTAYSEAQARADAGDVEAARVAFQRALAADPDFQWALEGLAALDRLVQTTRAQDTARRTTRYTAAEDATLAGTVDPRTRKKGATWTPEELAGLAVRWAVLHNRGEHCERYAEMRAYLDRVDWAPHVQREALVGNAGRWRAAVAAAGNGFGYEKWNSSVPHPDKVVYLSLAEREEDLWDNTHAFVFQELSLLHDHKDVGMATSMLACFTEPALQQRELDDWRKQLVKHGKIDEVGNKYRTSTLTNGEQLPIIGAWGEALAGRTSPGSQRELEALLTKYPDEEEARHRIVLNLIREIARVADQRDRYLTGLLGLDEATIAQRLERVVAGGPPPAGAPAWCAPGYESRWTPEAKRMLERAEGQPLSQDTWHESHGAARIVRIVGDLGCLDGVPGRYETWSDVREHVKLAPAHRHPVHGNGTSCESSLGSLQNYLTNGLGERAPGQTSSQVLLMYFNLISQRCIVETSP